MSKNQQSKISTKNKIDHENKNRYSIHVNPLKIYKIETSKELKEHINAIVEFDYHLSSSLKDCHILL